MGRPRSESSSVTPERASRLAKFVKLIAKAPRSRSVLLDKLDIDLRGFYRDVKTLRALRVGVSNRGDQYQLDEDLDNARGKLPCPDPQLTLAELKQLTKGTTDAHKKLRKLLDAIVGSAAAANGYHRR